MTHSEKDQKRLDRMTERKKIQETSFERMAQKSNIVEKHENWYITGNEMPHKEYSEDYIIWIHATWRLDKSKFPTLWEWKELRKIIIEWDWKWYWLLLNPETKRSVKRFHLHLIKY